MRRVLAVAANTFRETVRERVLYNLVFFAILMTLSGLLLRDLSIRQDDKIIKDLGLAVMDLFGTLIAIFLGVGLVSKEIERRSLYPLLAKPLSRAELFMGKFAGLSFTLLVNTAVMAVGVYLALLLAGRPLAPALLKAVYPMYLSFLLVVGALPFWQALRGHPAIQASLSGVNAGVVGLLLAALYEPIWTTAIRSRADFGLALAAFALLMFWKVSPVVAVIFAAFGGWLLGARFSL